MVDGRPATQFVSSFGRLLEGSFIGERVRLGNRTGDDPDEKHVPHSASNQAMGRKLSERASIARSFVAKAVHGFPFTFIPLEPPRSTYPSDTRARRILGASAAL
jgi:hypothetical protein